MKKIKTALLVFMMLVTIALPAHAANEADISPCDAGETSVIEPRVEETRWYFRNNNGVVEKRLWSLTYGVWLTEWTPVVSPT